VGGSRRKYSAKKHLEHSTPSKSTSFTLPVGRERPQQEDILLNLQALRNLSLQLACLGQYIRGADLQDCKTGKLTAAMGLPNSCLGLAVFSRRFKNWIAVSQGISRAGPYTGFALSY
jgi:hypothetical protein